jgi:hypothetical protein
MQESSLSEREERIVSLASAINNAMRAHPDRDEAIDAYDMARVFFRRTKSCDQVQTEDREAIAQLT